jgi:hypothetical protein
VPEDEHVRTPTLPSVQRALAAAAPLDDRDHGAAALAVRYAELLDEAVAAQRYVKAMSTVQRAIDLYADNLPHTARQQLYDAWERISAALAEHTVASDLGPKLLAALTALQLTPAARAQPAEKPANGKVELVSLPDPLAELQEDADSRWKR